MVGILLFLYAKTPTMVILCSVAIFALLVHPAWRFWWVEDQRWRQVVGVVLLAAICVLVGYGAWPHLSDIRPYFSLQAAEIRTATNNTPYKDFDNYYFVAVDLINGTNRHAATQIHETLVIIDAVHLDHDPIKMKSGDKTNEVGPGAPLFVISSQLLIPNDSGPMFIFCGVQYRDSESPSFDFSQGWYFKFPGSFGGEFTSLLIDASSSERSQIVDYLRKRGITVPMEHDVR